MRQKWHSFHYEIFMFYLDLDEIDGISKRLKWMSRNRFNLFNFRDKDHLQLPRENPDLTKNIRQHIKDYLLQNGVDIGTAASWCLPTFVLWVTSSTPCRFTFVYNVNNEPVCSIVEVCNTFLEMKPYFLGADTRDGNRFTLNTEKYFYVSPFIDMDTNFDFDLQLPGDKLKVKIDDYDKEGKRFFIQHAYR